MWVDELLSEEPVSRDGCNLLFPDPDGASEQWARAQMDGPDRYQDPHYEEDPTISRMFGGFIAVSTKPGDVVLDIGCGISEQLPHYVDELGLKRYLGLEPLAIPVDREYPCLVGSMAEHIPLKDNSVDVVLFGTSLDHIEDEDAAIREVGRVLKPGGRIIFWQGLYDADLVGTSYRWTADAAHMVLGPPLIAYRMWKRRRMLANGTRLDNIHFRYYTRERLNASLARWGLTKVRVLEPRGATSIFIEATQRP